MSCSAAATRLDAGLTLPAPTSSIPKTDCVREDTGVNGHCGRSCWWGSTLPPNTVPIPPPYAEPGGDSDLNCGGIHDFVSMDTGGDGGPALSLGALARRGPSGAVVARYSPWVVLMFRRLRCLMPARRLMMVLGFAPVLAA